MTKSQKKYLNLLIKIGIVVLTTWYVVQKVSNQKNLAEFNKLLQKFDVSTVYIIVGVVSVMMLANWFVEVIKWRFLIRKIEPLGWGRAIQSVFCGLTWAIFTPNRIGEYGGRIMVLRPRNRAKGAISMGVGLFAQLVLTSIFGALSIAWFVHTFLDVHPALAIALWILASAYAGGFLFLYFNVRWVEILVGKIKFLRRIRSFFSVLQDLSFGELRYVLLLSLCRFVIFTTQYIVLMEFFLPELPFVSMVLMIFILFFIQSALPSLDIFDFSVRSFVASHLYAYITTQEIAIMAIVSCIWFVNLIVPAIVGLFFVFNVNYIGGNGRS